MATNDIVKLASEYDLVSIMQDIGSNYFGADLSTQRVGMFGFLTESMAHMVGASIVDSSIRSKEYNVSTAMRMETLLYESSMLGLDLSNAVPSTMSAYIGVRLDNIIKPSHQGGYATRTLNPNFTDRPTCTLVLEKDAAISIANYDFMFEYDIQIRATWSGTTNKYIYAVRYLTEGDVDYTSYDGDDSRAYTYPKANTIVKLTNNYIQSYIATTKDGEGMLLFKVNLRQMAKNTQYYSVIKNDMISLTGIDFLYDNMLSHFNVYYKANNREEWKYIKAVSVYDNTKYDEDIVHYEVDHDESKLRLNIDDFTPDYNSEFRIDIYSTTGSGANNLTYSGTGEDITVTLNSLDERHSYAGLEVGCMPIGSWSDGEDVPTLEELRTKVIRMKASLNSLDTDYDLYNYIKTKDDINDYVFIKKRSDIVERRYATFTIPRLLTKEIIPSTTLNLIIPRIDYGAYRDDSGINYRKDESGKYITVKAGTPMILRRDSGNYQTYEPIKFAIDKTYVDILDDDGKIVVDNSFNRNTMMMVLDTHEKIEKDGGKFDKYPTVQSIIDSEKDQKVFCLPYTISYDIENQICSFYMTSIIKSYKDDLSLSLVDDQPDTIANFAISRFEVERNSIRGDDCYTLTVNVIPNGDFTKAVIDNTDYNTGDVANILMLKGFIYDDYNENVVDGYFDFEFESYSNEIFTFKGTIKIDDSLDTSSAMTNMLNLHIASGLNLASTADIESEQIDSDTEYRYPLEPVKPNKSYLNMDVFGLKIGIGIYYLADRDIDPSRKFIKTITDIDNSDYGDRPLVDDNDKNNIKVVMSKVTDESISTYPEFIIKCKYETEDSEIDIPVKYTLTDVYDNSTSRLDLYTDMSDLVRSPTEIISEIVYNSEAIEMTGKISDIFETNAGSSVYGMFKMSYFDLDDKYKDYVINDGSTIFHTYVYTKNGIHVGECYNLEAGPDYPIIDDFTKLDGYDETTGTDSEVSFYISKRKPVTIMNYETGKEENIFPPTEFVAIENVPVVQYSHCMDETESERLIQIISSSKEYLEEMNNRITNNFSLDYKFFRTYGPGKYFQLSTSDGKDKEIIVDPCDCDCCDDDCDCKKGDNPDGARIKVLPGIIPLDSLDIKIEFNVLIRNGLSVTDNEIADMLKKHIKEFIENLNEGESDYTIYMSNIITELEMKYMELIKSIELVSINGRHDSYRILMYNLPEELRDTSYRTAYSKLNIREYVPEFINVPLDNITINITRSKY